ncbi:MAG: DEAD/DEAH box helicase [archaeon]|jgi:helicase
MTQEFDIPKTVLERNGFPSFNQVQEQCVDKLQNNLVVNAPTASGKTVIAELFMLEQALNEKKKVIYTCPLRALASEHYRDFKKKYPELKFALATGDIDSSSSYLKKFDVIFTTYEKLASLLRHKAEWLSSVNCLIIDEIHELDSDRGPVLEIATTQLRNLNKNLVVLGLSATISNAKELSQWLDAKLVLSDFRPVKLIEGVACDNEIEYKNGEKEDGDVESVFEQYLKNKKQALFFLNSRKRAEGQAKKLCRQTDSVLETLEKEKLLKISEQILDVLEQPTEQCSTLAECIKKGSAFHHAGLMPKQKELVEDNFKLGLIKSICATTTVAAGVNLPADIVFIPTLYRYGNWGMELISVREYAQMAGRSGRPKFSTEGKSIVQANSENQKEMYLEKYLNGQLEPITSKLSNPGVLRTHILALIAVNEIYNDKSIWSFFEKTLYSKQSDSIIEIYEKVIEIIDELVEFGFVENKGDNFVCTKLGKRVSDLFLDPKSAFTLVNALKNKKSFTPMSYLFAWSNCSEFFPIFRMPKKLSPEILEEFNDRMNEIPFKQEKLLFEENSLDIFYSALLLEKWVNEENEQELFTSYGLAPGVLFGKTRVLEWLAYATIELSKVLEEERHLLSAKKLSQRIKYGVREELLPLVELKGIGRVRARKLFRNKITKPSEIKKDFSKVEQILGKKVSEQLAKQLQI